MFNTTLFTEMFNDVVPTEYQPLVTAGAAIAATTLFGYALYRGNQARSQRSAHLAPPRAHPQADDILVDEPPSTPPQDLADSLESSHSFESSEEHSESMQSEASSEAFHAQSSDSGCECFHKQTAQKLEQESSSSEAIATPRSAFEEGSQQGSQESKRRLTQ